MQIIKTKKLPIYIWATEVEDGAMQQALHLAEHPFAEHHICLLPDVHEGFGMPIGAVLATKEVIIPNAVGVDIGCGMCAIKTNIKYDNINRKILEKIVIQIKEAIPLGFKHHKKPQPMPQHLKPSWYNNSIRKNEILINWGLGWGNHFIEIQRCR